MGWELARLGTSCSIPTLSPAPPPLSLGLLSLLEANSASMSWSDWLDIQKGLTLPRDCLSPQAAPT